MMHLSDGYATEIVHQLMGHALGLELAGAFIRARQLTFKAYVDAHQKASHWTTVLKRDSKIYGRSLVTAWEVSYQYILGQLPLAAEMLTYSGFMDFDKVPLALFKTTANGMIDSLVS